jgi:hypothetical protein
MMLIGLGKRKVSIIGRIINAKCNKAIPDSVSERIKKIGDFRFVFSGQSGAYLRFGKGTPWSRR